MGSTTTLRCDTACTGTNPDFTINANPWRKYVSVDLGQTTVGGNSYDRTVRAGVLVVENWLFNAGPHQGETRTLVLVATTTNEVFCYSEGALFENGAAATPLWQRYLGVPPIVSLWNANRMPPYSNIRPLLGVCGTPVVDTANRRMFVVAMWDDGSGKGRYSIFSIALDTGNITASEELVYAGAQKFDASVVDQRTAINLVGGWLWFGFGAFFAFDLAAYFGWVVAVNPDNLTQQLFQPMISQNSSNSGIYAGGIWGPGGVAAADDGSVYALTGNATGVTQNYWSPNILSAGPGSISDYFNAVVQIGVDNSGSTPQLTVLHWFQDSTPTQVTINNQVVTQPLTEVENAADWDFGGSSPVVLPSIAGRQLVAFVPKDGNIFVLDSQNLGNFSSPLTRVIFSDAVNTPPKNDTKAALAFLQTPDGRNILIVGADTNGSNGGFAAFELNAAVTPPTLNKLWQAAAPLRDSFGSPSVIANPVTDPSNPPSPIGLAWVIDGDGDPSGNQDFLDNCALRAYDVLTGVIAYDSTDGNDISEEIPHFAPITSGGNSVFVATTKGFMGFTQFVPQAKSLAFIVERSTFGMDEVDSLEPTSTSVASFGSAYWIAVSGMLPSELGLNSGNLAPTQQPVVTTALDPTLPHNVSVDIKNMLSAAQFTGSVVPQDPTLPDQPQTFLFPYTIAFTGDKGFQSMKAAMPPIGSTLVTLNATLPGIASGASTQIELVTGENPYFLNVNPKDPTQPTWLSFDLRLFKVTLVPNAPPTMFGAPLPGSSADAPSFIAQAIANLKAGHGTTADGDSFEITLQTDEEVSALEFNSTNSSGQLVFNFALARVRLVGKTTGPTPYPVRVFFRLFQAQNTVSNFDTTTTYRFATDGTLHGRKVPRLGVQNDAHGNPEYVTIPCFASARINLSGPAKMDDQKDLPNAYPITIVTPGVEVDSYFGCWVDINQEQQAFLPPTPPTGNYDGPWTSEWMTQMQNPSSMALQSIRDAITHAPHQCLIAEIRYDDAPVVPNATSATSDKLAQRNIAWIDGPNPGVDASRRMSHPIQVRPTPHGVKHPDELMIFWGRTPAASRAELYLPALSAATIVSTANRLYPTQHMRAADPHTVTFDARGVSFVPLPAGTALAAGLLTVMLPPGIRKGDQYTITVRQLSDAEVTAAPQLPTTRLLAAGDNRAVARDVAAAARPWRRVAGAFQFIISVKTKEAILLNQERLLATLRWILLGMPKQKRWFPVLQRYIAYVAGVVGGSGGQPNHIQPSPTGWVPGMPKPLPAPPKHHPPHGGAVEEFTGKIQGLIYDRFGDFEGFVFETMTGAIHRIFSREPAVRDLAHHAQVERLRVHVVVERDHWRLRQMIVL